MQPHEAMRALVLLPLLLWEALTDLRRKEISPAATMLLVLGGVAYFFRLRDGGFIARFVSLGPGVFLICLSLLTRGKVGFGDGVVVLALGLWLPFLPLAEMLFLAFLFAAVYACVLLVQGRRGDVSFPFLPFLLPAAAIILKGVCS